METYVIGDVHGCYEELTHLLIEIYDQNVKLHGDKPLRLVFVGDLIDKGPNSIGVVEQAHHLLTHRFNKDETIILMGNHEDKFLRWLNHEDRSIAFNRVYKNPISRKPEWNIPLVAWGNTHRKVLESFPLWYKIPEHDVIVVHGGIAPAHKNLPPKNILEASRFQKSVMFTRFVNPQGHMVQLGMETHEDIWWAESYDGRFGKAIYGHQAYQEVKYHAHAIGIDTGVVYGNKLTAYRVSDGHLIQVKAQEAYAQPYASEGLK